MNTSVDKPKSYETHTTPLNVIKEESLRNDILGVYSSSDDEDFLDRAEDEETGLSLRKHNSSPFDLAKDSV